MSEIKRINERPVLDYMARDYESFLESMREIIPQKLPEWKDFKSETDFGNVLLQLFAHMGDIISYYQDRVANESFLGTAQTRRSVIHHLRLIGYTLKTAAPAAASLTLAFPAGTPGPLTIRKGFAFATKSTPNSPSVRFEYTGNTPLVKQGADLIPADGKLEWRDIPVEEGKLIRSEIVGRSDGSANQRFPLGHAGLILRPIAQAKSDRKDIEVIVSLDPVVEEWSIQESLAFSQGPTRDFVIEIDEEERAFLAFGDGRFGAIPPAGSAISATYRVGGGVHGNVPKGAISTIVDAQELSILGAQIVKASAATGGADRESIAHAVRHAPRVFRALQRAVTAEDYKALALNFAGVGKVRVVDKNWNRVTLYVAPQGGGRKASDVLKADLLSYFHDKKPISVIIEIDDVKYREIFVAVQVRLERYYDFAEIRGKIEEKAGGLLSFDKVDFAEVLYISKFYEAIESIEGVASVEFTEFRTREEGQNEEAVESDMVKGKIILMDDELPCAPLATDEHPEYADYESGIKVELVE